MAACGARRKLLHEKSGRIEAELGEGPRFAGRPFHLADAVLAPIFRYFDVFDRFADLGAFAAPPRVRARRRALAARLSVRDAVVPGYEARLEAVLSRRHSYFATLMPAMIAA